MDMRICIAIPSYKRAAALTTLLNQLEAQTGAQSFEVFVLNDGNDSESGQALLSARPSRFLLRYRSTAAPSGLPSARNRLLDHIEQTLDQQSAMVVFLDDDCEVNTDFVQEVARMSGYADAFAFRIETVGVSGILNTMQNRWLSAVVRPFLGRAFLRCGIIRAGYFARTTAPVPVEHLPGGCLAYRFDRYRALRFDERLNEGNAIMEDTDFSRALVSAGAVLWYDGTYGIVHRPPSSGGVRLQVPARKFYYYWKHKAYLSAKWAGKRWLVSFAVIGFFEAALVSLLKRRWLVPYFMHGVYDALRGRFDAPKRAEETEVCSVQSGLDPLSLRGGEVFDVRILQALAAQVRVDVLIPRKKPFADFGRGFSVHSMRPMRSAWRYYMDIFWSLRRYYAEHPDALLRVHSPYKMALPVRLFVRMRGGILSFAQYHHVEDDFTSRLVTRLFARSWDAVSAPSRFTRDELVEKYGVQPARIMVAKPGVSAPPDAAAEPVDREKVRALLGADADDCVILTMGSLIARKNAAFLLEVIAVLPDSVQLWIVGDGPLGCALRCRADRLKCAPRVHFTGGVSGKKKHELLSSADIFALPSLKEGYGMSVLESARYGVPALVSDRGSLPEIVEHQKTGLVVPLEKRAWADAVEHLIKNRALLAAYGEAARVRAQEQENWNIVAGRVRAQMEFLIQRRMV